MLDSANREYAQRLGQELFDGRNYYPGERDCPFCGSDLVRLKAGGKVECPICGAAGILKADNIPDFSGTDHCRFSQHEVNEHFGLWLKQTKQRFREEKDRLKEVQKNYRDMDWWIRP